MVSVAQGVKGWDPDLDGPLEWYWAHFYHLDGFPSGECVQGPIVGVDEEKSTYGYLEYCGKYT